MAGGAGTSDQSLISFTAELSAVDDTTLVRLPDDASERLPSRGQVAVHGSISGHDFETVVEPDGRRGHWIRVEDSLSRAVGLNPGDSAEVSQGLSCP